MNRMAKPLLVGLCLALPIGIASSSATIQVNGRIVSVHPEKSAFVLSENFKNLTFQVNNQTRFVINEREAKLADLQVGDTAVVTFNREGRQLVASLVQCTRKTARSP